MKPGLSSPVRRGPGEPVGRKSREGSNPSPGVCHFVQIQICPQCGKENPKDKNFCVWCSVPLKDSLMADTVKRFHADQEAQKELEELREKMTEMETVLKVMAELPEFDKLIKKAARQSPRN